MQSMVHSWTISVETIQQVFASELRGTSKKYSKNGPRKKKILKKVDHILYEILGNPSLLGVVIGLQMWDGA